MTYLLDANVFIAAKNLHYGLDFCPAFWDWLLAGNESKGVFSVEKVGVELKAVEDKLYDWAAERGDRFFLKPDPTVLPALSKVSDWVHGQAYEPAAVSTFLQVADYYLVAQALAGNHTVVTHEVPSASVRRIRIPDVCIGLGIKGMTPYEDVASRAGAICAGDCFTDRPMNLPLNRRSKRGSTVRVACRPGRRVGGVSSSRYPRSLEKRPRRRQLAPPEFQAARRDRIL